MERWSSQEEAAVARIHAEYLPRLRALSRRLLGVLAGADAEAEDVVQSALGSLCRYMRAHPEGPRDRSDIWRLLCHIVACKSRRRVTRQTRGLRGGRVRPMTDLARSGAEGPIVNLLANTNPAQFDLIISETLESLDPSLQRIALLALEGWTHQEIADRLECSRRTVLRKFERIRAELQTLLD